MGTPEDVAAEKHFTPPVLTESLFEKSFHYESTKEWAVIYVEEAKRIFKEWLRTVSLPQQMSEESTRQLLITLIDEPWE